MMTCKELSTLLSRGEWESAPWSRRISGWVHLSMCRHCRSFRRQLEALGWAARQASADHEQECSPSLEQDILKRLQSKR